LTIKFGRDIFEHVKDVINKITTKTYQKLLQALTRLKK